MVATIRTLLSSARLIVALLITINGATAAPITLNAGDTVVLNFDFAASGAAPPPPYPWVFADLRADNFSVGDSLFTSIFPEPDLQGTREAAGTIGSFSTLHPAFVDGQFSMSVEAVSGSFTIDPLAYASDKNPLGTFGAIHLTADVFPSVVPEPTTLALLAMGLAGFGFSRRRRPFEAHMFG